MAGATFEAPREALARRFTRFAEVECHGSSPLYEHLASSAARDDELLALAADASEGQPAPNLLFAAVHFLLIRSPTAQLARFYPSLTAHATSPRSAYPVFRSFCSSNVVALRQLLTTRRVQTNEVGRCSYLFPAFVLVAAVAKRPLALIEVGTSAGLNLLWDRYGYRYGSDGVYGNRRSSVQLSCELRGAGRPPLTDGMPDVARKVGIDVHVIDVGDEDAALWLRALVWPEARERARLLENAIAMARRAPPSLRSGDGITMLPDLIRDVPDDAAACVFHTHTLNQFSLDARARFSTVLSELSTSRDIYQVSAEWLGTPDPQLELAVWRSGQAVRTVLATCDHHGRWLAWMV